MRLSNLLAAVSIVPALAAAQAPAGWADFTKTFKAYADSDQVVGSSVVLMKNGRVIARYDYGF